MIPKFRAWLKKEKKMILVDDLVWDRGELQYIGDGITYQYLTHEFNLMQSTGLFDKNGKEIFEDDILDYKGKKALVTWHGSYASFIYRLVGESQKRNPEWDPLYLAYMKCEIVGNIWEDGELLE